MEIGWLMINGYGEANGWAGLAAASKTLGSICSVFVCTSIQLAMLSSVAFVVAIVCDTLGSLTNLHFLIKKWNKNRENEIFRLYFRKNYAKNSEHCQLSSTGCLRSCMSWVYWSQNWWNINECSRIKDRPELTTASWMFCTSKFTICSERKLKFVFNSQAFKFKWNCKNQKLNLS